MKTTKNNSWMTSGILLPGCMFIGIGIGMLYNATPIGLFIGMGVGFISMGIVKLLKSNESNQNN